MRPVSWGGVLALLLIGAGPTSAQPPGTDPAAPPWRDLLLHAEAAFDAGIGQVRRLEERAAQRGAEAAPGLIDALDVDARWDHDASGGGGHDNEVGVDAALRFRPFGAASAKRARWEAEGRLALASRDSARWRYLDTFVARYIDASVAAARADHVREHLDILREQLAPLTSEKHRRMVRAIDRMELEIEVARVEAELARADRARVVALAALTSWLGDPAATVALAPLDFRQPVPSDNPWEPLVASVPCAADCRTARASAEARQAHAAMLDTEDDVTLSAGVGFRQEGVGPTWLGVLAGVSIPLSHPAADEAAAMRALAERDLAEADWQQTLLARELADAAARWVAYRAEVLGLEERLLVPVEARHAMVIAARKDGFATVEQVIRSSRDLLETHDGQLEARSALWSSTLHAAATAQLLQAPTNPRTTPEVAR